MLVSGPITREDIMRAIGHFCLFVGFFLVLSGVVALALLGASLVRTPLVLLTLIPASAGLYRLYSWCCRRRLRPQSVSAR